MSKVIFLISFLVLYSCGKETQKVQCEKLPENYKLLESVDLNAENFNLDLLDNVEIQGDFCEESKQRVELHNQNIQNIYQFLNKENIIKLSDNIYIPYIRITKDFCQIYADPYNGESLCNSGRQQLYLLKAFLLMLEPIKPESAISKLLMNAHVACDYVKYKYLFHKFYTYRTYVDIDQFRPTDKAQMKYNTFMSSKVCSAVQVIREIDFNHTVEFLKLEQKKRNAITLLLDFLYNNEEYESTIANEMFHLFIGNLTAKVVTEKDLSKKLRLLSYWDEF